VKPWRLPKTEGSILKYRVPPLWPTYISERRTSFFKAYRTKVRCYGEHVAEHIGNLRNMMETHGKLKENIVRTHWESGKMRKNPPPLPPKPHPKT
jgi:hypothetical protein